MSAGPEAHDDTELGALLGRAFPECRVKAWRALAGGVSARAVVADLGLRNGATLRLVVRRPTYPSVEERRRIVTSEYRLLTLSAALGLRAPRPYFQDLDALAVGLEYIEGAPDFAPKNMADMLDQMAMELARIHRVPATAELEFLPRANAAFERELANAPERLDTTLGEERLRAVLRELWPWNGNPDVLLHGDYWPGNLLWNDGRLAAVLDWEEARIGDPLFDIAISRLDLVWAFGDDAMVEFTERYRTHATIDWENLARWDLAVALRPMSNLPRWVTSYAAPPIRRPDVTLETMRDGHRRFVERALRSLGLHRA